MADDASATILDAATTTFDRMRDRLLASSVGTSVLVAVLREIARGGGYAGRTDIGEAVGVTQATVSRAVNELVALDVVEPGRARRTAGRPIIGLALSDKRYGSVGIRVSDLPGGAIELASAVTALNGRMLAYESRPVVLPQSVTRRQEALVAQIARLASDLIDQCHRIHRLEVLGVGVQIGGHVHAGSVVRSVNVTEVSKLALDERLATSLGVPVVVENDLTALAVLEALFAPLQRDTPDKDKELTEDPDVRPVHLDSFALVGVFDAGLGGGLVIDGRVHRGGHGLASEIGHIPVDPYTTTMTCRCGRIGCLEAVATPARLRQALRALGVPQEADQELIPDTSMIPPDLREAATAAFRHAGRALGRALAVLTNLVDPAKVVMILDPQLDRGRGDLTTAYRDAMKQERREMLFSPLANPNLDIIHKDPDDLARLHAQAAAAIVLERLMVTVEGHADQIVRRLR